MKKFYLILMTLIFGAACAFAAVQSVNYSKSFIKNFKDCSKYTETVDALIEGKTYKEVRNIAGNMNGMCNYKVTVSDADSKYLYDCWFSEYQVEEIYDAMRMRSKKEEKVNIEIFAPITDKKGQTNFRVVGITTVKGTKAYVTWAKYRSNPYFCYPKKL